jgi:hypothetical protein
MISSKKGIEINFVDLQIVEVAGEKFLLQDS